MTRPRPLRRRLLLAWWRLFNPVAQVLAGLAPWWVVLETTGRRTGRPRRVPLARGPIDASTAWLIAVHGRRSSFALNIAANPRVRLKIGGRWRHGTAALVPLDESITRRFNLYARGGLRAPMAIDPMLVRVELDSP